MGAKSKISEKMMEIASVIAEGRNNIIQQGLDVSGLELKGKKIFLKGTDIPVIVRIDYQKVGTDSLEIYKFFMENSDEPAFIFGSVIEFNLKEHGATIKGLKYHELLEYIKEKNLKIKL